jgi:hypothetical protein
MDGVPERRAGSAAPSGDFSLLRLVQERGAEGVPLCREFAEMMLVDIAADVDPMVSSYAAVELMSEPQTRAENVAASLLVSVARFVRDQQPDDENENAHPVVQLFHELPLLSEIAVSHKQREKYLRQKIGAIGGQ